MTHTYHRLVLIALLASIASGCTGIRYSYQSKVDKKTNMLHLKPGDVTEVLAIANGFPGWWGVSPGVKSTQQDVASIECKNARSFIPFRKPGVIFGGEVCKLTAHKKGTVTLYFGNIYSLSEKRHDKKVEVIVSQ